MKSKTSSFQLPFQSSQPTFQPSTSTPSKPFFAAKSMYFLVFSVVAPCFPEAFGTSAKLVAFCEPAKSQVDFPTCISHQIPIYFIGLIHEVSSILDGSFRLRIILELTISLASSLTIIVLQGETQGVCK